MKVLRLKPYIGKGVLPLHHRIHKPLLYIYNNVLRTGFKYEKCFQTLGFLDQLKLPVVPGPSRSPYQVMPALFQRVLLWQEHGFNEIAKRATIKQKYLPENNAMFLERMKGFVLLLLEKNQT